MLLEDMFRDAQNKGLEPMRIGKRAYSPQVGNRSEQRLLNKVFAQRRILDNWPELELEKIAKMFSEVKRHAGIACDQTL